jgi:hypothetical protein
VSPTQWAYFHVLMEANVMIDIVWTCYISGEVLSPVSMIHSCDNGLSRSHKQPIPAVRPSTKQYHTRYTCCTQRRAGQENEAFPSEDILWKSMMKDYP